MALEADAENILRAITPTLDLARHKGQAGKLIMFIYLLWLGLRLFFVLFAIFIFFLWLISVSYMSFSKKMEIIDANEIWFCSFFK